MWIYEKKLQYPVKIKNPNPALAKLILTQLGGPDGELGASMRYLNQRYVMPNRDVAGILTDIGTEYPKLSKKSPLPEWIRTILLSLLLNRLLICNSFDNEQCGNCDYNTERQADPDVLNESGDNEHYKGYCRYCYRIRHLC